MLDPTAHLGNALLCRHGLLQELFPSFTSFSHEDDYCHRYILRSIRHHREPMGPRVLSDGWDNVNEACGIEVEKLTHIFRVQTQQEITDKGCSGEFIRTARCFELFFTRWLKLPVVQKYLYTVFQFCLLCKTHSTPVLFAEGQCERLGGYTPSNGQNKVNEAQLNSYLTSPPVQGVCAVGGGDPNNTKAHYPVWANQGVADELLRVFAPWFFSEYDLVNYTMARIRQSHPPKKAKGIMRERRLYMAEGALRAIRLRLVRAIQLASSRPYDPITGILRQDSEPMYVQWQLHPLYKLAGFRHPLFLSFASSMKTAQDMAASRQMVVPGAVRNEVERVVTELVLHPMQQVQATQNAMLLEMMEFRRLLATNQAYALSNVAASASEASTFESQMPYCADQVLQVLPLTNKKGEPRKKAPKTCIATAIPDGTLLWSKSLTKAREFWCEYQYGLMGQTPLRQREAENGSDWRSDRMIKTVSGKTCGALKNDWSQRAAIYNWILYRVEDCQVDADLAIEEVQAVFDRHLSPKNSPRLILIAKELRVMLRANGGTPRHGRG
jgi:hypothetical protein